MRSPKETKIQKLRNELAILALRQREQYWHLLELQVALGKLTGSITSEEFASLSNRTRDLFIVLDEILRRIPLSPDY